ncbi:MAG: phage-shock protein [Verrucomicrobiota bacterium]
MDAGILVPFFVIGLPIICGTAIAIVAILKGSSSKKKDSLDEDETLLLQEIHAGMARLEKRIDALETIVIENEKPANHKPTEV